ncbi:GEVED domain-containing protein [Psychroflexus salis]|uniref:Por secretion system C-terminal sorting domain-containing protein n=1 Tax=Psychroflexus salis TaxID=1526574 RepID=A0A916ZX67_9FLAO|nr:GEVED domain-containing protein [Psychroflexus salis]GGE15771.1 hypothetical protein GCM10010831_16350 [Psychroflexus salis]
MNKFLLTVTFVLLSIGVSSAQYCVPTYATGCASDLIEDFSIPDAGFSHLATGCSPDAFGDFTDDATLEIGMQISVPYNFEIVYGSAFTQSGKIWIDFNGDEVFEDTELLFESSGSAAQHNGVITIPNIVATGVTRMRVMSRFGSWADINDACTPGSSWGETHDYTVNILPAPDCPMPSSILIDNITGVSADLSFDEVAAATNGYTYNVYLEEDDIETATPIVTETLSTTETTTTIVGLSGQTDYKLTLQSDCDGNGLSNVTSPISFTTLETCIPPNGLEVSNITENSVDLSWDEVPNAIDGYEWSVFIAGADPEVDTPEASGLIDFGTNQASVSSLPSGETFQVYVTSNCGDIDGISLLSLPVQFATLCSTFSAPYFESFDDLPWVPGSGFTNSSPEPEYDPCWSANPTAPDFFWGAGTDTTGSSFSTGPSADRSGDGNYIFVESSAGSNGDQALLFSPIIDLSTLSTPALSFYYHMRGTSIGTLTVEAKEFTSTDWTEILSISGAQQENGDDAWLEAVVSLSGFENQTIQVRFNTTKEGTSGDIAIDEFEINEAPTCFDVTGFSASAGLDTATFNWDSVDSATDGYILEVYNEGEEVGVDSPFISESLAQNVLTYEAIGLTEGTNYIATINSICGADNFGDLVTIEFSTVSLGDNCQAAIEVPSLPYTTTDDTTNYSDFYEGSPGAECGSTSPYLGGNDVVYSYTPDEDMVALVSMTPTNTWSGIFVYESCEDIGNQCLNGVASSNTDIRQFEVSLTGGQDYYIVISTWPSPQTTGYDLEITEVLCGAVSGLETTFVGSTVIDFAWDAVPNAVNYQWELYNNGDDPETVTPVDSGSTADTFVNFTDLDSATAYDFYVQSECADNQLGDLTGPLTVVTECEAQNFPTPVEDFENANFNYNTNDLMPCWSEGVGELTDSMSIDTDSFGSWGAGNYANTSNTENGQAARINVFGTGTSWLVSQQIDLGDGTTDLVIQYDTSLVPFSGGNINSPQVTDFGLHTINVVVSTDGGNTWSDQNIVNTYDNTNIPSPDQTEFISLAGYSGIVKIGFYVNRISSTDLWFSVDNFRVIEAPDCFAPLNLNAVVVGIEDVEFTWETNPLNSIEDAWEVQYGLEGFELDSEGATSVIVNGNPETIVNGLESASDYEFYVRSICSLEDASEWRGPEAFRSPIVPIEIGAGEFHNEVYCYGNFDSQEWLFVSTADENLDLIFNAGSLEDVTASNDVLLIYDGFNENGTLIFDSSVDGAVLAGLTFTSTTGGFYMILTSDLVQSCQGGQGELPEELDFDVLSETFSTPGFGKNEFSYYPNPVQTSLNIQSDKLVESIELFNISGQKLRVKTPNSNTPSIQMQDLPSGMYLMKVTIDGKIETFQIIKE